MTDLLTLTDLVVDIPHRRGTLRAIDGVQFFKEHGEVHRPVELSRVAELVAAWSA